MIETIIRLSVRNKLVVGILVLALIAGGIYNLQNLSIDAVPDITNNQVQVVTVSGSLAPQEVEQFITYPVEVAMANIPNVLEIRSISRFGLSVVTIVFEDFVPVLEARQFVKEQISMAQAEIPPGLGTPELMPITTGLGEIYQYVLEVRPGYETQYDDMQLRTIQDWIVKRQLAGIPGIIEISSFGGHLKQYEIALDPLLLKSMDVSIGDVFESLAKNNQNTGGSYIEKNNNAYYIRTEGIVKNIRDIENIPVSSHNGVPILVRDVASVQFGSPKRFGAMTMDGKGEAVGGITLMLKGGNSSDAIKNVHNRIAEVKKSLPEGVEIYPYLDRSVLVGKTINTVKNNLLEGGLIVIAVLVLLLGNLRSGLIVASIIPLAMLFAIILMNYFGVSANLMSLGAIDFGIVIDGAVIVVEGVTHVLFTYHVGKHLTQGEMDGIIIESASKLFRSAVYGVFIILVVFIPIMTLTGIEGKMFRPMAMTFSFAVFGALLLSLTYVPAMSALVLPKKIKESETFADKIVGFLRKMYQPVLRFSLKYPLPVLAFATALLIGTFLLFQRMGAVFIPTLEEGDLAMQMTIQPGSSLQESIKTSTKAEKVLLENFPEVMHVVSKIGTAEVPTDPMAIEDADIMIILKEKEEWTSAVEREELVDKMKEKLKVVTAASFEFTQPIQLRFNELMTGAKTDIAVKIFGENPKKLKELADHAAAIIEKIPGAADVKVEQTDGLPQLMIQFNRDKIAYYGLSIEALNTMIRTAFAGETAGVVFENERKFDLVVRLHPESRQNVNLNNLFIHLPNGTNLPLDEVTSIEYTEGPMQISRESARRFIGIGINVRNRDIASLVAAIENALDGGLVLPAGYSISYGGQFENLQKAQKRLALAVPVALALIFALLYFTFEKIKYALMIFSAVPLSAIGGVLALWLRDMPFSISAGVGFIALFGVAVLNGIVLISYFNQLRYEDGITDIYEVVIKGGVVRLRPVIMTATVAALGFLPMALSTSNGAELQRPLATVVIGGLITATLLTLLVLPVLYYLVNRNIKRNIPGKGPLVVLLLFAAGFLQAQTTVLSVQQAVESVQANHPGLKNGTLRIQQSQLGIVSAREVPSTHFGLQSGQINSKLMDYNLVVSQSFGNPAANEVRKEMASAQTRLSEKELDFLRLQHSHEVQLAWHEWAYRNHRLELIKNQEELHRQLVEKSQVQYRVGQVGKLETTLAQNKLTQTQKMLSDAGQALELSYHSLKQKAWLEGSYTLPPNAFAVLPLPDSVAPAGTLIAPFEQMAALSQWQTELQKKILRPEFSVLYFNQSIRPNYSLQGVGVGVSVPLFKKAQQARTQQAQIEELMAVNELELQAHELNKTRQMARRQCLMLQEQLNDHGRLLLSQANQLRQLTAVQLAAGEIDYFQYIQSIEMALQNELEFTDLLYRYNQAILLWTYLMN